MERVQHPAITPLEISDLCVDGATLWEWSQGSRFGTALRQALDLLHAGGGSVGGREPAPDVAAGFDAVFLTGGRVIEDQLLGQPAGARFVVVKGAETVFGGECGGFEFLQTRGLSGWVADLGKSQLKIAAPGRRWTFPRDWTRLPLAEEVPSTRFPALRRRLREFLALSLQIAMAEVGSDPRALVFALPTRLDADGTPRNANYAGMRGDQALLPDALQIAGLGGIPLFVFNDAELAALSALSEPRLARFNKVLVLTLGFGIGAALIQRAG